jgi:serine/threonine-protein phosphatase 2A activator
MFRIGATKKEDRTALVLKVFLTYLTLMRKLQRTYYLEPAGSHGVWRYCTFSFCIGLLPTIKFSKKQDVANNDVI